MKKIYAAILDSLPEPILFVDNDHIIRYMNKAAAGKYFRRGGQKIVGKSVIGYHQETSRAIIANAFARLQSGENEVYMATNRKNQKVYMRAVRTPEGELLGYYERFE